MVVQGKCLLRSKCMSMLELHLHGNLLKDSSVMRTSYLWSFIGHQRLIIGIWRRTSVSVTHWLWFSGVCGCWLSGVWCVCSVCGLFVSKWLSRSELAWVGRVHPTSTMRAFMPVWTIFFIRAELPLVVVTVAVTSWDEPGWLLSILGAVGIGIIDWVTLLVTSKTLWALIVELILRFYCLAEHNSIIYRLPGYTPVQLVLLCSTVLAIYTII